MGRRSVWTGGVACLLAGLASCGSRAAVPANVEPEPRTIVDGVYTGLQARYGASVFNGSCSRCHSTSEWKHESFLRSWSGKTVDDLYVRVYETMPPRAPGSLSAQEYVDVVTYLFRLNELPTGEAELTPDAEVLRSILIVPKPAPH